MLTAPLRTQVLAQLGALRGLDFQQAVVELLYLVYGAEGFSDLRPVRDRGADGLIVVDRCCIACYGPEHRTLKKLRTKLNGDYALYSKHWRDGYPNWRVYINRQASPEEIQLVDQLHAGGELWGVQRIVQVVERLPFHKLRNFCRLLQIDDAYVARDFLIPLLDDLVATKVTVDPVSYRNRAPEIALKIRENYPDTDVATMETLFALTVEQQHVAEIALAAYDETDLSKIKTRIVMDFAATTVAPLFRDRMKLLLDQYVAKYNPGGDDALTQYIQSLLFLLFAQCLIGQAPKEGG